jgi:hypothetical protein
VVEKLMRNALLRRRSVVNDPMFQSLFPQLINRHTVVLMRMNKLEADRGEFLLHCVWYVVLMFLIVFRILGKFAQRCDIHSGGSTVKDAGFA